MVKQATPTQVADGAARHRDACCVPEDPQRERAPHLRATGGARPDPRATRTLAFFAFLAFVAGAGISHLVSPAADAWANKPASEASHTAYAPGLGDNAAESVLDIAEPPMGECDVVEVEGEDTEEDGRTHALAGHVSTSYAPNYPTAKNAAALVASGWKPQFSLSAALPRGPPRRRC